VVSPSPRRRTALEFPSSTSDSPAINATYIFRGILASLKTGSFEYNPDSQSYQALSKVSVAACGEELKLALVTYKNVAVEVE